MSLQSERVETKVILPDEMVEKNKELNNLRNELERVKKDKGITTGLVTQMQRDMSSKVSGAQLVSVTLWWNCTIACFCFSIVFFYTSVSMLRVMVFPLLICFMHKLWFWFIYFSNFFWDCIIIILCVLNIYPNY